ncbi:MAG: biotin carboxylase N-terminal domain-containing protein, partial [Myxococcota bacterium]
MFNRVLIANRGEIALRVLRACRELGIETVAVHSTVDEKARHVRLADQAICIGPADATQSYLNVPALLAAAEISGADAIHPGYGFLSENAEFADLCNQCGLTFIGPTPQNMNQWGDKVEARKLAKSLSIPLMEGSAVLKDAEHAAQEGERVGFPVMLKASGGGGGRGMKIIRSADEMRHAFPQAQAEALAGFNNGDLYCERFVEEPRHIEFQVLADGKGKVWVLGERECSIQRRHQKLVEEAPSVAVSDELRRDMAATLKRALVDSDYVSAGTVELLMDERGNLAFMEMNTRIQVEHPVTELITG